ncbi:MAG: DUF1330 domain-containing protein [Gammaproteobacteria bacterium]|nr:DUF1330 domain-containing protein [Gammaproteobacteria bacterium]MCP5425590.1 DUF1330 domain-containing protein [Gammaproteobacteria bacterium]MCP5459010.1 DUF1330 domain-containing protein [Gammaproteobacteria bacterium]
MVAYVIVEIRVTNSHAYEEYKAQVPASIEAYGGRYLVRGGHSETLEGAWSPQRLVVLEFASLEQAKAWHRAQEYRAVHEMRRRYAVSNMVVVEGMP